MEGSSSCLYFNTLVNWKGSQRPEPSAITMLFARWQQHIRFSRALSADGKESFIPVLDPDANPDHHQNLITSKLGQV